MSYFSFWLPYYNDSGSVHATPILSSLSTEVFGFNFPWQRIPLAAGTHMYSSLRFSSLFSPSSSWAHAFICVRKMTYFRISMPGPLLLSLDLEKGDEWREWDGEMGAMPSMGTDQGQKLMRLSPLYPLDNKHPPRSAVSKWVLHVCCI